MANTQSSTILSGAYVNPFAQKAQPTQSSHTAPVKKPEFAALIAEMDEKLLDHSAQTAKPKAVAQNTSDEYTFLDFIDMINPLQHIPVVSNIYRAITGDEIRQEIRMAGNIFFGALSGPVGMAMGAGSAAVDYASGKPVGDHVLAAVAPDLETTIRKEYSIAHYLHNPFADNNSTAEIATVTDAVTDAVPQVPRRDSDSNEIYAQTASAFSQSLNRENPQTNRNLANTDFSQMANLDIATKAAPNLQTAMLPEAQEAQAMAKSVAYNPQSIVQLSPDAAAQLSQLASGTAETDHSFGLELFGANSDGAAQLRAATAKNRQLGIALNSSASISNQLDTAGQRNIAHQIGDKVAALYNQNADITRAALSNVQKPAPSLFDAAEKHVAPAAVQVAQTTSAPHTQPVQPQQLGKHYHGVHHVGNLSIAAAMQQALDKYQNLRRN